MQSDSNPQRTAELPPEGCEQQSGSTNVTAMVRRHVLALGNQSAEQIARVSMHPLRFLLIALAGGSKAPSTLVVVDATSPSMPNHSISRSNAAIILSHTTMLIGCWETSSEAAWLVLTNSGWTLWTASRSPDRLPLHANTAQDTLKEILKARNFLVVCTPGATRLVAMSANDFDFI